MLYAGNNGKAQNLKILIPVSKELKIMNLNIKFIIIGGGSEKQNLKNLIIENELDFFFSFKNQMNVDDVAKQYQLADVLFVSLKADTAFQLVVPNKIQSYLAAGKPIVGSIQGEGRKVITTSNSGLCSNPDDVDKLVSNLKRLYLMEDGERNTFGDNGYDFYLKTYSQKIIIPKLEELLIN